MKTIVLTTLMVLALSTNGYAQKSKTPPAVVQTANGPQSANISNVQGDVHIVDGKLVPQPETKPTGELVATKEQQYKLDDAQARIDAINIQASSMLQPWYRQRNEAIEEITAANPGWHWQEPNPQMGKAGQFVKDPPPPPPAAEKQPPANPLPPAK